MIVLILFFFVFVLFSGAAFAVDVFAVVTEINSAVGPVGLIGGSTLLVLVAIKVYKWVRRAM
jgi:Trk-type K+ transport system membrane component